MAHLLHTWYQQQAARLAYHRGCAQAQQSDHTQAIASFTQALKLNISRRDEALVNRGASYLAAQNLAAQNNEQAIADFETVIDAAETSDLSSSNLSFTLAQAHYYRGLLRKKTGNEAGALVDWSIAISYWPTYPEPYYQRALIHLSQSDHQQALRDLDTVIKNNPAFMPAYLERGNLRYQLKDIPGAVADWEIAVCNDFTLEEAKSKLATVHQSACDAKLTDILKAPLAAKSLSVEVTYAASELNIHIYRQLGTGVNYYTLPDLIREHLAPLHLADINRFQLIGHLAEVNKPEWNQSYELYKGQACPPSNWQTAFSALVVFPPFGIPAFIQAAKVKRLYERGHYIESLSASKSVKGLCVAGSITLGFFTLLPLSYAAYDSMKAEPTFQIAKEEITAKEELTEDRERRVHRPYYERFNNAEHN